MKLIIVLLISAFSLTAQAQTSNLIVDGSFENQEVYENKQIARIALFGDLGEKVQRSNPVISKDIVVSRGVWYKKASNSGYLRASIINSDSYAGENSLLLSINKNSPQKNLDRWDTTAVIQFVELSREVTYLLKFSAKSNIDCEKIFAGAVTGNGSEIAGSSWVNIDSEWKEYTIEITPSTHKKGGNYSNKLFSNGAVVFGLSAEYDDNGRTNQTSVLIDDVQLIQK